MRLMGISCFGHDAAVSVVEDQNILFAGHAERYSGIKNDPNLNSKLLSEALHHGYPSKIVWYEKPFLKRTRMIWAGQKIEPSVKQYLLSMGLGTIPIHYVGHHHSHAAGGYYTSSFDEAAVIVVDAIGEWDTISVWHGKGNDLKKIWSQKYPHSLGLLYSAFTQRCGFKPNEEEFITMGLAAFGHPTCQEAIENDFIDTSSIPFFKLKSNVHRGILDWRYEIKYKADIAASIQKITEEYLVSLCQWVKSKINTDNLVISGGVALNCVANSKIAQSGIFKNFWIMPNPGDAGSSLGAIAAYTKQKLNWSGPYLGTNIEKEFDHKDALDALIKGEIIGIAHGRAEFGPRALGNRSLVCDPRGLQMKQKVNALKNRQPFRPFAPIIKEELVNQYFDLPVATSPYMQFVGKVLRPDLYPAITHEDGTARVQTLSQKQNPTFWALLDGFHKATGCPMLLNTSLNIKGQPLVNDSVDVQKFQEVNSVKVF